MLITYEIELKNNDDIKQHPFLGSLLHGVLQESIEPAYADRLHQQGLKPYSQYLYYNKDKGCYCWKISTIAPHAFENIINKLENKVNGKIHIAYKNLDLLTDSKQITKNTNYKALSEKYFIHEPLKRKLKLQFVTPTSFKSGGDYTIFPDIGHIYQSLLNKWNSFATDVSLQEDTLLQDLTQNTRISGYDLKSTRFSMEGVNIKSFKGSLWLYVSGPDPLARIARLLLAFGEFSGVGVKCSLGMGGIHVE